MSEKLTVGISDWKICRSPDSLITYALGSCVGICLYDKNLKLAGLAHIMLPDSTAITGGAATRAKFADTAIVDMVEAMKAKGGIVCITADHGNADQMIDPDTKDVFTAHTTNPVPFIVMGYDCELRQGGRLADIAPTLLDIMGLEKPSEMSGESLIK